MIKALIITAPGINCDLELAEGFALAGATPWSVHINELLDNPTLIDEADFQAVLVMAIRLLLVALWRISCAKRCIRNLQMH